MVLFWQSADLQLLLPFLEFLLQYNQGISAAIRLNGEENIVLAFIWNIQSYYGNFTS